MTYEACKFLHVLGVVLLLGNVTVSAVWKVFADRTRDARIVAFAQHMITVTDIGITLAGIGLTAAGGYGAVSKAGIDLIGTPWLVWGQAFFAISGVMWLGILVPLQWTLARQARNLAPDGGVSDSYRRQSALWLRWGVVATVPLVLAVWVMVAKP